MKDIIITFEDGTKKEYRAGITLENIIKDIQPEKEIICGCFENTIINYYEPIVKSGKLTLYGLYDSEGARVYEKGLTFLFRVAAMEILGKDTQIKIRNSIDRGVFFEIDKKATEDDITKIKNKMKEKVEKAIPFEKVETTMYEAINYFKQAGRIDKIRTLFYNKDNYIKLYKFDGIYNYIIGTLPHNSSLLKLYDLTLIPDKGIVLRLPSKYDNGKITKYKHHEDYFNNISAYLGWAKILGISSIGELNDMIVNSRPGEVINMTEAIQEYVLQDIAGKIVRNRDRIKLVLLSGPSSSGKTTTARKLSMYLKATGLNPISLSLDDYFLNRDETPLNDEGKPDYESLKAIDTKLFNTQIKKLLKGGKVSTPTFNFLTGVKEYRNTIEVKENDILVIEGLHTISEELLTDIPKNQKFKIYISPLVYINIDDDNRINLTDVRLIRRLVRDNRTRGYNPSHTLSTWSMVRDGEEKYIFPYQDNADAIYNTFLIYELPVLKVYALPLLHQIKDDDPEYLTARRLIKLLDPILPLPSEDVPSLSIIREFIGKGYFE